MNAKQNSPKTTLNGLLKELKSFYTQEEIQRYLWLFLKASLSADLYLFEEPREREEVLFFYENMNAFFTEAYKE